MRKTPHPACLRDISAACPRPWGTKFFDFDNDGWLDLFITNGHTMEQLEEHFPADTFAEPDYLLHNLKGKELIDVSAVTGIRKLPNKVGRGTAFGDFDNDGDIDVLVINKNDVPFFFARSSCILSANNISRSFFSMA